MKIRTYSLLLILSILSACASGPPQKLQSDDKRACAQNFSYDGSFWSGRTFKTHDFVPGVTKIVAVERAAKDLAVQGWAITNIDKELGIITAEQTVSYGKGKTAPLNISIDSKDSGVKVSVTFSISGGLTTPVNMVKDSFCDVIESVGGDK